MSEFPQSLEPWTQCRPQTHELRSNYYEIKHIKQSTSDGHVNGLWNSIFGWAFPSTEGYITRPPSEHTEWSGKKGFSDFHTFEWDEANNRRIFFLITQCKPEAKEGQDRAWEEGAEQLGGYLMMLHGKRPARNRQDVYGILAVRRRVRFFRYSDANMNVVPFRPGRKQIAIQNDREFFDIVDDASKVMAALRWIRRHRN